MEVVRTGLSAEQNLSAGHPAQLRGEVLGLDAEFLQRFDARKDRWACRTSGLFKRVPSSSYSFISVRMPLKDTPIAGPAVMIELPEYCPVGETCEPGTI